MMAEACSYSEPSLAAVDLFGSSTTSACKQQLYVEGTLKPSVAISVPASPASTGVPSPGLSPTTVSFPRQDAEWFTKHLAGLRADLQASRLDCGGRGRDGCEPDPAFLAQPRDRHWGANFEDEDAVGLKTRVVALEADVKTLLAEAECWRHRCLELEKDRAAAVAAEDQAQLELRGAQGRERGLAAQSLELRLGRQDAENAATKAETEKQQHKLDLKDKEAELEDAQLRLGEELRAGAARRRLQEAAEAELQKKEVEAGALMLEAGEARGQAEELREAVRAREAELESTRLILRGARAGARRQEEEAQTKEAELAATRDELSAARARTRSREELLACRDQDFARAKQALQHKELEIAVLNRDLREARAVAVAVDKEELRAKDEELCRVRKELQEALTASLARRAAHKEALESKEAELTAARTELGRALRDSAAGREALQEARGRGLELERRVQALEGALSSSTMKQADLSREAELFRARGEHQELVSQKLRLDLQDAIAGDLDVGAARTTGAQTHRPITGAQTHRTISPPRQGPAHAPPRSARTEVAPVPPPPPLPAGRMEYPRSSVSRRLRKEVLTARGAASDRTLAQSRYDSRGRLVSFDAHGRAVP